MTMMLKKMMEKRIQKEQDELKLDLGTAFIKDVEERIQKLDLQYLTGLKKLFKVYMIVQHKRGRAEHTKRKTK